MTEPASSTRRRQGVPKGFCQDVKDTVQQEGSLEACESLMKTDAVHCELCPSWATLGHTHCKCRCFLPGGSGEVKKQVLV